jgi:tRNA 5-methylaminomethyl-2-thiouridine biosynthesis bifunctional protein
LKTSPIVPAELSIAEGDPPLSPQFSDLYHPRSGPFAQARQVFLRGNGLPSRWQGRTQFTIVETGFGLGNNFLATWAAWQDDPQRCERLHFVSFEKHPLRLADLQRVHQSSPLQALADQLIAAWPPLTPNLHTLEFEVGRLRLLLAWGDAATLAREVVARADAFFLDGFAPARNEAMWSPPLFKALARLAAPGATVATWSAARAVREGLAQAGFAVQAAAGGGAKRDITLATFAPHPESGAPHRTPPVRQPLHPHPTQALIIGGGLAGAATARALMQRGIACTVIDRHAQPAGEASGNPAGLFHGTMAAHDGTHARWHRAASFHAARAVREAIAQGVSGAVDGFLRLESVLPPSAMQSLLDAQRLPPEYLQALDATSASTKSGMPLPSAAWFYPDGGWVDPRAMVTRWLQGAEWIGQTEVAAIQQQNGGLWQALDSQGLCVAQAPLLVLANARDALRLAGLPESAITARRGQLTWCAPPSNALAHRTPMPPMLPLLPIASGGYVLRLPDGSVVMGATNTARDDDDTVRDADHAFNLDRATQLLGASPLPLPLPPDVTLEGRVSWRAVTRDRLPLIGPVPDLHAAVPRRPGLALIARRPGLWLHTGLGSRGITTAALGGELIAGQALGEPWPLEADLAEALDPARMLLK